ncbi:MAG: hypothetical protein ACD_74C00120G0001, partial [uncultured bacterium]
MDVRFNHALVEFDEALDAAVFAELGDQFVEHVLNGERGFFDKFFRHELGRGSGTALCHMQGDVLGELDKGVAFSNKIGLAVNLDHHAQFAVGLNERFHQAFAGCPAGTLLGNSQPFLPEQIDGFFHVAAGFGQGFLAIHHARVGFVAELFYHLTCNIHGSTFMFGNCPTTRRICVGVSQARLPVIGLLMCTGTLCRLLPSICGVAEQLRFLVCIFPVPNGDGYH